MTIRKTLLANGYFPKELPPSFFTDRFAEFASEKAHRSQIDAYAIPKNLLDCVEYSLALPGLNRRELRIPHPVAFAHLVDVCSKSFGQLLKQAQGSSISRSAPAYNAAGGRSIRPRFKPSSLPRERTLSRAGSSFLVKTDISHFYPALYTHAVGWSISPKTRERKNWGSKKFLGARVDNALMGLQARVSQGIPIGNDLSFLLSEIVLTRIDKKLAIPRERGFRWYDDYEIAFETRSEAEAFLAGLSRELAQYRMRLNPVKTSIKALPLPAEDEWRDLIHEKARSLNSEREVVQFFDTAFRLRAAHPDSPVLLYALGSLFALKSPSGSTAAVAQSGVTQALLAEPGVAQKALMLLRYWSLNGLALDIALAKRTIERVVTNHSAGGSSSDVAWALFFCIENNISLGKRAARELTRFDDDAVAIQACHMEAKTLLTDGFSKSALAKRVASFDPDGPHWLAAYELVRQGHATNAAVSAHPVLSTMLADNIPFYRDQHPLPPYGSLLHPGGAPEWAVTALVAAATGRATATQTRTAADTNVLRMLQDDVTRLHVADQAQEELVATLLGADYRQQLLAAAEEADGYT